MHKSFLTVRNGLFGWLASALTLLSIVLYAWHDPIGEPNGGTWLGYTLGTLGAILILWLLWFGVRKRQYQTGLGQMTDWLSAHVYLGMALLFIATLHCGFEFGWNVHTLAYVLMTVVIVSGMFGVYIYVRYPALVTRNRKGVTDETMLADIADLDRESLEIASKMGDKVHQLIQRSIERTDLRAGVLVDPLARVNRLLQDVTASLKARGADKVVVPEPPPEEVTMLTSLTMIASVDEKAEVPDEGVTIFKAAKLALRKEEGQRLLDLIANKKALVARLQRDLRYHAWMKAWLRVHVPLSIALLAALIAHVVSVFYYW